MLSCTKWYFVAVTPTESSIAWPLYKLDMKTWWFSKRLAMRDRPVLLAFLDQLYRIRRLSGGKLWSPSFLKTTAASAMQRHQLAHIAVNYVYLKATASIRLCKTIITYIFYHKCNKRFYVFWCFFMLSTFFTVNKRSLKIPPRSSRSTFETTEMNSLVQSRSVPVAYRAY